MVGKERKVAIRKASLRIRINSKPAPLVLFDFAGSSFLFSPSHASCHVSRKATFVRRKSVFIVDDCENTLYVFTRPTLYEQMPLGQFLPSLRPPPIDRSSIRLQSLCNHRRPHQSYSDGKTIVSSDTRDRSPSAHERTRTYTHPFRYSTRPTNPQSAHPGRFFPIINLVSHIFNSLDHHDVEKQRKLENN